MPQRPPAARARVLIVLILIAAVVAMVQWPVLGARGRCLDDHLFVTNNALVSHPGWRSIGRFFAEVRRPSTVRGYYLPLTMTSLMTDYALGGRAGDPFVFHATNLLLHVLSSCLILLIMYRLFGSLAAAAAVALLFGIHPLAVEPLAWVSERKTTLSSFFALASMACYVEYCRRGSRAAH